jgi:hypothetical protein
MDKETERQFEKVLISLSDRAWIELGYKPTRFLQMLREHGAFQTAKLLLHSSGFQYGFEILWEHKRLDLSLEAIILKSPWNKFFTNEEKEIARRRLLDCGYNPDFV